VFVAPRTVVLRFPFAGTRPQTWPSRSGARRLLLGLRTGGLGDNYSMVVTTAPHSFGGPGGSSRLCTQGPAPHTEDLEFEGWLVEGFDSRSRTPERGAVRDGPQRPEPGRTSVAGILNCVRVLMKKEVMVFPPNGKAMSRRVQTNGLGN
jgi:hypothetical protein